MANNKSNINKVSKEASNGILRSFSSLIKVGNSLPSAIEVLIQVEKGKSKKTLERVHKNITKLDYSIGKALLSEGIIAHSEVIIVEKSTNALESIQSILEIRELEGNFEKSILKLFMFPVIAVIIGLTIAYLAQPTFHDMVYNLVAQVKVMKGIDLTNESHLIWYLEDRTFTFLILQVYIVSVVVLLFLYFYYLKYKPESIYGIFPLKAYDDVPYILMLIRNLQKVGLDQVRVYETLKDASPRVGWVKLFDLLEKEARAGRDIYPIFERFKFPKDVVLVLKSSEVSRTFWDSMDTLV